MRLHLGCGGQYLPGALNLDRYDPRVADAMADVRRLPLGSECSGAVVAHHLLEHLGYIGAVYFLAECSRVLRPGGVLELETPDPEGSFRAFLERADPAWRAAVLTWVCGEERPGQGHGALFPRELLEKLVGEAGFEQMELREPRTHRHRWGLRLLARRSLDPAAWVICRLRPVIASEVLSATSPQEALELEQRLWEPLRRWIVGEPGPHRQALLEAVVVAPRVLAALAELDEIRPEPVSGLAPEALGRVARALVHAESCQVLRQAFAALCANVNEVEDGFEHLVQAAGSLAESWLERPPRRPVEDLVAGLEARGVRLHAAGDRSLPGDLELARGAQSVDGRRPAWPAHHLFTREHLAGRAAWFRDVGIRCFGLGDLDRARQLFRLALNSKLEGVYSVWNMARLQARLGQVSNAAAYYRAALEFPLPDGLRERLELEAATRGTEAASRRGPVAVGEGVERTTSKDEEGYR